MRNIVNFNHKWAFAKGISTVPTEICPEWNWVNLPHSWNAIDGQDGGRYVTGDSLAETEARLDPAVFFRCHKSYIINLNHISNITPYGRWTYVVRLSGITQDALITHEKYEELEQLFS